MSGTARTPEGAAGRAPVEARGLTVGYGGRAVLEDVTFAAGPAETVAILGPNGGGKTTLLRALLGELVPLAGSVHLARPVACVAQSDRTRLDFPVSALDVALMGALARGRWWRRPGRSDREAARAALERVGLGAEADARFGALSGGQRRRVLLARALVQDAQVLLLDEPFAGVDQASAQRIVALFAELRAEGRTLLVTTHDIEGARAFDRVLCLNRRQVCFGPPGECLGRAALEATYGSEIVVLEDEGGPTRAITVQHHDR
jgi:ABC-type Mn2+/Zn2+ transport system ATPase subunit